MTRDDTRPGTPVRATFRIQDARLRASFLSWAQRTLPCDRAVVLVRDVHAWGRACWTRPISPEAELVAVEAPLLTGDAITQVTRYYVVPDHQLRGEEVHAEDGRETHRFGVDLLVACRGRSSAARAPA